MLFFYSQDWLGREDYHKRQPRLWCKIPKDRIYTGYPFSFLWEVVQCIKKIDHLVSCWNCIIWYIMLKLLVTTYLLWGKQMLLRDAIKRRFSKSAPLWFRSNLSLFYAFLYTTLVIFYFSKAYYSPEKKSEILLAN